MAKMKETSCVHSSPMQPYDSKLTSGASKGKSNSAGKKQMSTKLKGRRR